VVQEVRRSMEAVGVGQRTGSRFTANSGSLSVHTMIKKRTRPQTRVRDPSPDSLDPTPTDSQQEKSEQDQDEGDIPYAFVLIPAVLPNVHPSATVSLNSSNSANFGVHGKGSMHPS
jgi:hypothetical protein